MLGTEEITARTAIAITIKIAFADTNADANTTAVLPHEIAIQISDVHADAWKTCLTSPRHQPSELWTFQVKLQVKLCRRPRSD